MLNWLDSRKNFEAFQRKVSQFPQPSQRKPFILSLRTPKCKWVLHLHIFLLTFSKCMCHLITIAILIPPLFLSFFLFSVVDYWPSFWYFVRFQEWDCSQPWSVPNLSEGSKESFRNRNWPHPFLSWNSECTNSSSPISERCPRQQHLQRTRSSDSSIGLQSWYSSKVCATFPPLPSKRMLNFILFHS